MPPETRPHGEQGFDDVENDEPCDGPRIGRRIFLGLIGTGAVALVTQAMLNVEGAVDSPTELVPVSADDATRPYNHADRFRFYSVASPVPFEPNTWRLTVDGLGAMRPLALTFDELTAGFSNVAVRATFHCVTGWRVRDCVWRGIALRDVLDAAHPGANAQNVTFHSSDGVYTDSLTWAQARSPHALLAFHLNGTPLTLEQGSPLRLIYPEMFGYKNVKWVNRLEHTPHKDVGFWEQHGWEDDAFI